MISLHLAEQAEQRHLHYEPRDKQIQAPVLSFLITLSIVGLIIMKHLFSCTAGLRLVLIRTAHCNEGNIWGLEC